jgi:RND family efflux transporter MFP subunit
MKTKGILLLTALMIVVSCKTDKKAELANLKKEHDQITEKIMKLEEEIADENKAKGIVEDKSKTVSVTEIKPGNFSHFIEVQGKLDGDENVSATAMMGGLVTSIYVKSGDVVKKDQIMVEVEHAAQSAQLKSLETNLQLLTELYDKQKALWDQKIGSEVQYLTAKTNKESLENQIKSLREQIDMCCIKAPINGTVEDMPLKLGQMMSPGLTSIRVVNFNKVKVIADIAEGYSSKIRLGDKVKIYFPDLSKEVIASISFASRFISPVNRTFTVEANILENVPDLKANMVAMLRIVDYSNDKAISIPMNYIQNDKKGYFVYFTDASKKVMKAQVEMGQTYNGIAEITKGLKPGDFVISSGYLDLEEGMMVNF